MQGTQIWIAFFFSAITCGLLVALIRQLAPMLGLVDQPNGRHAHAVPVPLVGGLAMFLALLPILLASGHHNALALAIAFGVLTVIGAVDDALKLTPRLRLSLESVAATLMIADSGSVTYLGNLFGFGPIGTSHAGTIFTVVCVVGLINAMNMVDGLDGLAGSLAFVAVAWLTLCALLVGSGDHVLIGLAVLGTLAGFLFFNLRTRFRSRAAVFMGDAGSMLLGAILAWFAIDLAGSGLSLLTPIGAVWIVGLPVLDTANVMTQRVRVRRSPFSADRRHLHYVLVDGGMPTEKVVAWMAIAAIACGAIGISFPLLGIPEWVMFVAFMAFGLVLSRWTTRRYAALVAGTAAPSSQRSSSAAGNY